MDFDIGLVNSIMNLPDGQVKFFEELKLKKNFEINLLIKTFLGLVEMMFGLVIGHFTVIDGGEADGDLVLIQTFLLYHVNQVILMLTSIFQGQFP